MRLRPRAAQGAARPQQLLKVAVVGGVPLNARSYVQQRRKVHPDRLVGGLTELERGESWRLSPAFDLNPNPRLGPKYLSTAIDFTDPRASVDTLLRVADYFRLDAHDALDVLREVTRAVARWRLVAQSHGLTQRDLEVMEPAFEHAESERARTLTQKRDR